MTHVLFDIGNFAEWATAVGIVIWTIQYSLLAKWWTNFIGITMVGEALCILAIFIPSLMALANPAAFAGYAQDRWYQYLACAIVVSTATFMFTRILTWESIRRQRGGARLMPSVAIARIAELEAENTVLRGQLGATGSLTTARPYRGEPSWGTKALTMSGARYAK